MCGRFSQAQGSRRLAAIFAADPDDDLREGSYNVAPTDQIRVVRNRHGSRRRRVVVALKLILRRAEVER